jgi:acetyl-CoA carboxylase biotin carboxyl carrier protein
MAQPRPPAIRRLPPRRPSPPPGAEPYVTVGGRVKVGQTVCIIEAMKIMNPIDAEVGGVIKEIVVQDAQPVEFGQVLFRVDPNG